MRAITYIKQGAFAITILGVLAAVAYAQSAQTPAGVSPQAQAASGSLMPKLSISLSGNWT